jgi:hypothetical protein
VLGCCSTVLLAGAVTPVRVLAALRRFARAGLGLADLSGEFGCLLDLLVDRSGVDSAECVEQAVGADQAPANVVLLRLSGCAARDRHCGVIEQCPRGLQEGPLTRDACPGADDVGPEPVGGFGEQVGEAGKIDSLGALREPRIPDARLPGACLAPGGTCADPDAEPPFQLVLAGSVWAIPPLGWGTTM